MGISFYGNRLLENNSIIYLHPKRVQVDNMVNNAAPRRKKGEFHIHDFNLELERIIWSDCNAFGYS